eukprot:TRINITY_DN1470_c0_g1_i2.p1 TRINITY_DN1470_c0_g1~~TRINITY_DN1470_c0_g1_i2.p1  ORF type:complete len:240 (-),score=27.71 TRINITY_DN1470_c0_g1_i2:322-1041(-)
MDLVGRCTCSHYDDGAGICGACTTGFLRDGGAHDEEGNDSSHFHIRRIIVGVLSGALTGIFALVTGALAGRASNTGVLRGAGLGAVAGAVLSVEVLEASRAYWCSERSGSRNTSSMADFIEELLHGRFGQEPFAPMVFTAFRWQVRVQEISYDEMYDIYGEVTSNGVSGESLKKIPWHVISNENKAGYGEGICCMICLQDVELGETVRTLPLCHHTFHLSCVDKWLVRHGSCPVCRQIV